MTLRAAAFLLCSLTILPAAPPKAKAPSAAQLQAQVKRLTAERDELKTRLAATESLQRDLTASQKSRELAREEAEAARRELDQLRSALRENQAGGESLLRDLQKAEAERGAALSEVERLRAALGEAEARLRGRVDEGELVVLSREITPARPLNLARVTPTARKVSRGVVVVQVLVSENGEVLDSRLLQPLPGEGEWVEKANEACVEAAKRLVFDPARAADGKTRVRVWQGVGFLLD